jgi:uncharacterized protein
MAYAPGFDYDIFVSFSHQDNAPRPWQAPEHPGWVEQFVRYLEWWLGQRRGLIGLRVWFDKKRLTGATDFDARIRGDLARTALFLVIHSRNYRASDYCRKELAWFVEAARVHPAGLSVNGERRIFNILINNIPHTDWTDSDHWTKPLAGTIGFRFNTAAEGDAESFGDPIDNSDQGRFDAAMRPIVDAATRLLTALPRVVETIRPPADQSVPVADRALLFLAEVPDADRAVTPEDQPQVPSSEGSEDEPIPGPEHEPAAVREEAAMEDLPETPHDVESSTPMNGPDEVEATPGVAESGVNPEPEPDREQERESDQFLPQTWWSRLNLPAKLGVGAVLPAMLLTAWAFVAYLMEWPPFRPQPPTVEAIFELANGFFTRGQFDAALARYREAATHGHAEAQVRVAQMYEEGKGTAQDLAQAKGWYEKAAAQGYPEAEFRLGEMYEDGIGTAKDLAQAKDWYDKAAQHGILAAQLRVAEMYEKGEGTAKDLVRTLGWYLKAAAQGHRGAELRLGQIYEGGIGTAKDLTQAKNWYEKAAQDGLLEAQLRVAKMYENAEGTSRDLFRAKGWYEEAAKQRDKDAQYRLAEMYERGEGTSKDPTQAKHWYEQAAEQDHLASQVRLAEMCESDDDSACARAWYERAAQGGDSESQIRIGIMFLKGEGVAVDLNQAKYYLGSAAIKGLAKAQFNLALTYSRLGQESVALQWYKQAAEKGVAAAEHYVGVYYWNKKQYSEARKWLRRAHEHASAQGVTLPQEVIDQLND